MFILNGPDVYLYLLLEFQSTPDWWMAVRAQVYEGLLWQHVIAEHRLSPGDPLPPVFLMVLYNGARPWAAPTDTTGLIGLPEDSPLWPWQPRIRYHLLDMGRMPEDALTGRDSLTSLLVQLERPHELEALKQVIDAVVGWFRTHPDYTDLRRLFTELIGQAMAGGGLPGPVPRDLMEMRTMLEILIEESKRKWRAEALAEGKAEGETMGRSEGQRQMLIRLIEHRFGPLQEPHRARVLSADEATLATWEKRLFEAQSIDDILAPPH